MKTELEVALRDPALSKSEMRELLTSNLEEVNKLTQISQTLLLLSRLEHSPLPTGRVAFDDIVRRIIGRLNLTKPRIVYAAPTKPLYIAAHQVSIEELVTILIDNALKYSPPSSKVHVNLKKDGKKARLEVINTGKGISPEDLPHIFERFYRVDESRTNGNDTGFGLGLSLAKKIVELHHGDFTASSEPNKETIFTVSLPLYEKPSRRKRRPAKITTI
jgi:signal transduction histidine kinase